MLMGWSRSVFGAYSIVVAATLKSTRGEECGENGLANAESGDVTRVEA